MSAANTPARVAALVLNYNGADDTIACLQGLGESLRPPDLVQVIDNASSDDSVARLGTAFPDVAILSNPENRGFGAGHNPWLRALIDQGFDWIWLLNNDARAAPDALGHLLEATAANVGVVGARLVDLGARETPHDLQAFGGGHVHAWRGSASECRTSRPQRAPDYITGACMLLNAAALRDVGLFDPRFFMYWEDVDLCLRMRNAGWSLRVAEHAVIRHRQSTATGPDSTVKDRLINASTARFFRKHGALGGWPAILIGTTARVIRRLVRLQPRRARAVLAGTLAGLR